jgi:hypothetical protein
MTIAMTCINDGGNAAPLRDFGVFGEYLVMFFVTVAYFWVYRFMLAGRRLRVLM